MQYSNFSMQNVQEMLNIFAMKPLFSASRFAVVASNKDLHKSGQEIFSFQTTYFNVCVGAIVFLPRSYYYFVSKYFAVCCKAVGLYSLT